jgi:hypothetical protein
MRRYFTGHSSNSLTLRHLVNYSKRTDANKSIKRAVEKYHKLKKEYETVKKAKVKYFKDTKEIYKKRLSLSHQAWKMKRKLDKVECTLSNMSVLVINKNKI